MRRTALALLALASVSCSRPRPAPQARPAPRAEPRPAEPASPVIGRFEDEGEEIMRAARELSRYPDTAEGLRALLTELARAGSRHDREALERVERELSIDEERVELALGFSTARHVSGRVVEGSEGRREALVGRLGALREPLQINVTSALGSEVTPTASRGFDPGMSRASSGLRPMVRFFRAEVVGADGQRVVVEPAAWLGGRWAWLGDFWRHLPADPPPPPSTVTAR